MPAHRVAWSSPVADTETGNVYTFGVNNLLTALTRGKKIWDRSITEEFSPFTTHGGRTVSPIIDGNLVIVSTPTSTWGTQAGRAQRFIALDKRTGDIVWMSTRGGRPYDTSYAAMNIVTIDGTRLLITGGADGAALAMKPQTGEPVWNLVVAKRGMNTGMVAHGKYAILSHGDENVEGNERECWPRSTPPARASSAWTASNGWSRDSWVVSLRPSSWAIASIRSTMAPTCTPSTSKPGVSCGRNLGVIQKASAVYADGKIYAGTESGKFYILRPHADRCEVLSSVELPLSDQGLASQRTPEPSWLPPPSRAAAYTSFPATRSTPSVPSGPPRTRGNPRPYR